MLATRKGPEASRDQEQHTSEDRPAQAEPVGSGAHGKGAEGGAAAHDHAVGAEHATAHGNVGHPVDGALHVDGNARHPEHHGPHGSTEEGRGGKTWVSTWRT